MNFLVRFFGQFVGEQAGVSTAAGEAAPSPACEEQVLLNRIAHLEHAMHGQRAKLERAKSLLQNASFLARYHQPTLARDIHTWIAAHDEAAGSAGDGASRGDAAKSMAPTWEVHPPGATSRLSA